RHLRGGVGHPGGRPGGGEEARLAGGPCRRLPGGLPQGVGPVTAPAAGLGTGTDGGVPAGGPGVRGPAPAGRPGQGRNDGAGVIRVVEAGAVVGGRRRVARTGGTQAWPERMLSSMRPATEPTTFSGCTGSSPRRRR